MEEYEKIKSKISVSAEAAADTRNSKLEISQPEIEIKSKPITSANIDEINLAGSEDITLEDLGLDELPFID